MTNIINLRQARKVRARAQKAVQADTNRAKFGRTTAERLADASERAKLDKQVDGAFRTDSINIGDLTNDGQAEQ